MIAPSSPAVPAGLVLRPYAGESDIPAIVGVINAEWEHDRVPGRVAVEEKAAQYRHASESFDARRDLTLAEVDGEVIGYGIRGWTDVADSDVREYRCDGSVVPAWRGRGIGRALLGENMRLARQMAAGHETARGRAFGSMSHEHQDADEALLRSEGFEQVRFFCDMVRTDLDDVPEVPLPEGLTVRPATAADGRALWEADHEAFRDHWGGYDDSEESFSRFADGPEFDPGLWVVAWDGERIAGAVINAIYPKENEALGVKRGWLDSVFTLRPYRRRGLARALIARALVVLRDRGMTGAILDVDSDNGTGALGLYESAGFRVAHRSSSWRKPM